MKTLLHRIKKSLVFRLCYRLVCWINYPTSRERMWHMYACGKVQGAKEALARLPITQVQPAVPKLEIKPLNLPPGIWSNLYFEEHGLSHRAAIPSQHEPTYWPALFEEHAWLNSKPIAVKDMTPAQIAEVPTIRDLKPEFDPLNTDEYPAIVSLLHQDREQRRSAG